MSKRPKINIFLFILLLLLFIIPAIIYSIYIQSEQEKWDIELLETVTSLNRGTKSELDLVLGLLKFGIPAQTIFHDLYINTGNNNFSQVDLVVATKVGIIVFEIKDYSGWIYGNGNQTNWKQVLAYGKKKYSFYNPIKQNNKHIAQLKKLLSKENVPFYSVIVFYGSCELKDVSFVPEGTFLVYPHRVFDVINKIMISNPPANYNDKRKIVELLKDAVNNGDNLDNIRQHSENINNMLGHNRIYK